MATRLSDTLTDAVIAATSAELAATTADPAAVVRIRGLVKDFGERRVLHGLDLDIRPGEFVALLGRSGSGKSTLLRALAGLDDETGGELTVSGEVAVAFQEPRLVPWKRVRDNVTLGLRHENSRAAAEVALGEVGLAARGEAWPLTLSGGEAQRASLARALVREPDLLLLDEPFSALDALTRITIHGLVLDLWARHRPGVLLVTDGEPGGHAIARNGQLSIPADIRRAIRLRKGDRVLLAAHPDQRRLIIVCQVALADLVAEIRDRIDGGEQS